MISVHFIKQHWYIRRFFDTGYIIVEGESKLHVLRISQLVRWGSIKVLREPILHLIDDVPVHHMCHVGGHLSRPVTKGLIEYTADMKQRRGVCIQKLTRPPFLERLVFWKCSQFPYKSFHFFPAFPLFPWEIICFVDRILIWCYFVVAVIFINPQQFSPERLK